MSEMVELKLPVSVKGVVLRAETAGSEVLLLRNERQEWELPGGRMEGNETPEACLTREFLEETGLEISIGPCVERGVLTIASTHVASSTDVCIHAYGCYLQESCRGTGLEVTISSEHKGFIWIPLAKLAGMSDVPDLYKKAVLTWAELLPL